MTQELKRIRRQRQMVYRSKGKCAKYLELKQKFDYKLKQEAEKYRQKVIAEVQEGKRTNLYSALRKLESGNNVAEKCDFTLPSHTKDDLTPAQSAERLADYFSLISQEFEPICVARFPPSIKAKLEAGKTDISKPVLEEWQVFEKILKSQTPWSPGIYLSSWSRNFYLNLQSQLPGYITVSLTLLSIPDSGLWSTNLLYRK